MATSSFTNKLIQFAQNLVSQPNAFLGHAAVALDTQCCIEAQASGISAYHLAMRNRESCRRSRSSVLC